MEKDPAKRFQSADSFLEAVQTAALTAESRARPHRFFPRCNQVQERKCLSASAEIPGTALNATAAELSPRAPTAQPARGAHKKGLAGPVSSATAKNPASTESQASPLGGTNKTR